MKQGREHSDGGNETGLGRGPMAGKRIKHVKHLENRDGPVVRGSSSGALRAKRLEMQAGAHAPPGWALGAPNPLDHLPHCMAPKCQPCTRTGSPRHDILPTRACDHSPAHICWTSPREIPLLTTTFLGLWRSYRSQNPQSETEAPKRDYFRLYSMTIWDKIT